MGQRLLWFLDHYRASADYGVLNCPVLCRITGPLTRDQLRITLDGLTARHDALRTTLAGSGRHLRQCVHDSASIPLTEDDLSGEADPQELAQHAVATELRTRFDLSGRLARARLWRLSADEHLLCLSLHHAITDAWSTGVLFGELSAFLDGAAATRLPSVGWQYPDFARHQHRLVETGALTRQQNYWLHQLSGAALPRIIETVDGDNGLRRSGSISVAFDRDVTERLHDIGKSQGTTLFAVLLAAFYVRMYGETGQDDLTVGSLFANRLRAETRNTVGFLANMAMLRARIRAEQTFLDLLAATHTTVTGAIANQDCPFQLLPPGLVDTGGMRPDDVVFQFVTDPRPIATVGELRLELVVPEDIGSRFGFELTLVPVGDTLRAVLFYRRDWFTDDWAHRFLTAFDAVVHAVTALPAVRVSALSRMR
ncbi:condensation domain-containing protein [Nocardia sp. NPDC051321]|uniref:condensation domain-containing protein n=1 Tax=Nocardia sp. NPDC051321 TaxID=3364323 RepID=UPI003797F2B5